MPVNLNPSNQTISQFNVQTGAADNLLNNVAPGAVATVLTSNGPSAQPSFQSISATGAFNQIVIRTFSTAGASTYVPTSGMQFCIVEVVGGGGGSGGVPATTGGEQSASGGGGGGGYARKIFTSTDIGVSKPFVVGAAGLGGAAGANNGGTGGTTTFGSILLQATGGGGGESRTIADAGNLAGYKGGVGGVGSLGDFNTSGGPGNISLSSSTTPLATAGAGGSSFFGGAGASSRNGITGPPGQTFGGGAGGNSQSFGQAAKAGANGAAGGVIITEYISV